jgi:NAD(P)-dependent dehydrogenase (short-subunit alcohol dehydrogenase family)
MNKSSLDRLRTFYTGRPVLVTGGASFIGSHLVELLVASGAKVVVADDLSSGRLENTSAVVSAIRFIKGLSSACRHLDGLELLPELCCVRASRSCTFARSPFMCCCQEWSVSMILLYPG